MLFVLVVNTPPQTTLYHVQLKWYSYTLEQMLMLLFYFGRVANLPKMFKVGPHRPNIPNTDKSPKSRRKSCKLNQQLRGHGEEAHRQHQRKSWTMKRYHILHMWRYHFCMVTHFSGQLDQYLYVNDCLI